jgi:alkyl sulfatase BDS1-like metallo-beta-lactamase superfamily hydrolase
MGTAPKDPSEQTRAHNTAPSHELDPADFERASRGLLTTHPTGVIETPQGVVWDVHRYDFISTDPKNPDPKNPDPKNPDTVHPSLWRQAQLNNIHGLFEVAPGIWQARGYDISNITFIAGATGWVIIDPLTAAPCARACLDLANATLGERPVVAVIYTHSHADHFGGVLGVTSREEVAAGTCQIIAPEHFMREAISENVIAGYAMSRRAHYQFGPLLPAGPRGHVDCGLGKAVPFWQPELIAPTVEITATGQEMVVDGIRIVFQLTPDSEAPAEMNFYFPDQKWLCTAENCTHNMHNLVPIRGAQARDSLSWSKYIDEMLQMFGHSAELLFASHHWPRWGTTDVVQFLTLQRDLYRWIHDQTMRMANHGHTATEIAEMLKMPAEFQSEAHTTGYYGHLAHNIKAVYQRYLSWYDGNPANLWKLPPTEAGSRYVALAGGPDALILAGRAAYAAGDYRWAAELVNHLVFADPTNTEAKELQADILEQLGYQSESATFRNAYLTGAQELRNGAPPRRDVHRSGYMMAMSLEQLFDVCAVKLKAESLAGREALIEVEVTDRAEPIWRLHLSHRSLHARPLSGDMGRSPTAEARITLEYATLAALSSVETTVADAIADRSLSLQGSQNAVELIFEHLDVFQNNFPIVEP